MSIRIGWTLDRPSPPSISGRHFGVFEFFKLNDEGSWHFVAGYLRYRRADLELLHEKGSLCDVRVIGVLRFAPDVTPALVDATIGTVHVTGHVVAREEVKRALRAHTGNGSSSDAST